MARVLRWHESRLTLPPRSVIFIIHSVSVGSTSFPVTCFCKVRWHQAFPEAGMAFAALFFCFHAQSSAGSKLMTSEKLELMSGFSMICYICPQWKWGWIKEEMRFNTIYKELFGYVCSWLLSIDWKLIKISILHFVMVDSAQTSHFDESFSKQLGNELEYIHGLLCTKGTNWTGIITTLLIGKGDCTSAWSHPRFRH